MNLETVQVNVVRDVVPFYPGLTENKQIVNL